MVKIIYLIENMKIDGKILKVILWKYRKIGNNFYYY